MADEELKYGLSLEDQMSGPAKEASTALSTLAEGLDQGKKALAMYQQQQKLAAATGNIELYRKYTDLIQQQRQGILQTTEAHHSLTQQMGKEVEAFRAAEKAQAQQASLADKMSKSAAKEAQKAQAQQAKAYASNMARKKETEAAAAEASSVANLASGMSGYAVAAKVAAGAVVGLVGAVAGAVVGLGYLAIHATEGKDAMIGAFSALGGGIEVGYETEEMLSHLSASIGITKDELAPLTKSFMAMGIEGTEALEKVTLAAASAQAIMGDPSAAKAFETLEKKIQVAVQTGQGLKIPAKGLGSLAEMGVRVDEVASRMGVSVAGLAGQLKNGTVNAKDFGDALQSSLIDKGAGPLAKAGAKLGNIWKMFGQSVEDMFEDVKIEPFLLQLRELSEMFDQNHVLGQAMKWAIGGAFDYIFDSAADAIPKVEEFFLDIGIWSLETYILVKEHWGEVKTLLTGVGLALGTVAIGFAAVAVSVAAIAAPIILIGGWMAWLQLKFLELPGDATAAGVNIGKGLIGGLMSTFSDVGEAAGQLGKEAIGGVKRMLGMHSPSKVMYGLGEWAGEPFAGGIEDSAPRAEIAGRQLGRQAIAGTTAGMTAADFRPAVEGASGRDGGRAVSVDTIHIEIMAPQGVTNAHELTELGLAMTFERLSLQLGM